MEIALSTAWNSAKHKTGAVIIREIRALDFKNIELGFNLTDKMARDIAELARNSGIKIPSLHNYCPIPEKLTRKKALPDCFSLASLNKPERKLAVYYTKRSINTAGGLDAKAVILHCGRVEMIDPTRQMISYYNSGKWHGSFAVKFKQDIYQARKEKIKGHLSKLLKSLDELAEYAQKQKVKLGIENRFYYREIPSLEEIGIILNRFKGGIVFYWHDTGHAKLWENLGFLKHLDYLNNYSSRLAGMHLHDIRGTQDHKAPLKGELDFKIFKKYIKPNTLLTMEVHSPATGQEIAQAKKYLEVIFKT